MNHPCPICADARFELYLDGDDLGISAESVGSSRTLLSHGRILRCSACGLGYRSFRPTDNQLAALYRAADDRMYEAEMPNRWRTARRHLQLVERHVPIKGHVLDIGCASGAFLRVMGDAGWAIEGIEPAASQYRRARAMLGESAAIQECVLQQAHLPDTYDLITLWDVLEHVVEPVSFLALAASHLREGGYLMLNVPRIDSIPARILGSRWPLLLAEHLNYFTIPSLRTCGRAAGIELIHTGQRPAAFSLGYVSFRAAQHGILGAEILGQVINRFGLAEQSIPVWLGEVYAIFRKPATAAAGVAQPVSAALEKD